MKATLVIAVHHKLISVEEACERYGLSREVMRAWNRAYLQKGWRGLLAVPLARGRPQERSKAKN